MAIILKPKIKENDLYNKYVKVSYRIIDVKKFKSITVKHKVIKEDILQEIFKAEMQLGNKIEIIDYSPTI